MPATAQRVTRTTAPPRDRARITQSVERTHPIGAAWGAGTTSKDGIEGRDGLRLVCSVQRLGVGSVLGFAGVRWWSWRVGERARNPFTPTAKIANARDSFSATLTPKKFLRKNGARRSRVLTAERDAS